MPYLSRCGLKDTIVGRSGPPFSSLCSPFSMPRCVSQPFLAVNCQKRNGTRDWHLDPEVSRRMRVRPSKNAKNGSLGSRSLDLGGARYRHDLQLAIHGSPRRQVFDFAVEGFNVDPHRCSVPETIRARSTAAANDIEFGYQNSHGLLAWFLRLPWIW